MEDEKFFLLGLKSSYDKKYKLVIDKLQLSLKAVTVDKDFLARVTSSLLRTKAIYPIIHGNVNFANLPANLKSHNSKYLFLFTKFLVLFLLTKNKQLLYSVTVSGIATGILPTVLFVGLLRNSAKSGDIGNFSQKGYEFLLSKIL